MGELLPIASQRHDHVTVTIVRRANGCTFAVFQLKAECLVAVEHLEEVDHEPRVELPIGYDGPEITITLDPRFVIDFLKVLDSDKTFTMELKDGESAAVCTTEDGYGYVIMPLARDR